MSYAIQASAQQYVSNGKELAQHPLPRKFIEVTSSNKNIASLNDFCQGQHVFVVDVGRRDVWKPKQSFFRGKFKIKVKDSTATGANYPDQGYRQQRAMAQGVQMVTGEETGATGRFISAIDYDSAGGKWFSLGLAYNAMSTLFSEFNVSLSNTYLTMAKDIPHIDTICKRMNGNSGLNESFDSYLVSSFHRRHKLISEPVSPYQGIEKKVPEDEDGVDTLLLPLHSEYDDSLQSSAEFELNWRPHFGVLNSETLHAGNYRIEFQAENLNKIKSAFVQSLHDSAGVSIDDYMVELVDFRYYVCLETAMAPITGDTPILDYVDVSFQQKDINSDQDSTISWDMPKGLQAAAIAFQSESSYVGAHPFYSKTLFTVPYKTNSLPVNAIKLNDFFFDDGQGKTYPTRPFKGMGKQGAQHLGQIHKQNQVEQGNVILEQPSETLSAFYELGPYLYFQMELAEKADRHIQSNQSFTKLVIPDGAGQDTVPAWDKLKVKALLFSFRRRMGAVKYDSNGFVTSVLVGDK